MQGQDPDKPAGEDFSKSLKELEEKSSELKAKIDGKDALMTCLSTRNSAIRSGKKKPQMGASIFRRTRKNSSWRLAWRALRS